MTAVTTMLPRDMQLTNEYRFSRKHIDRYIEKEILENPDMVAKVAEGVQRLTDWMNQSYHESKNARLAQLKNIELEPLVMKAFVVVAYCQIPELFTAVSAQLAGSLRFSDRSDSILTMAEILAVLCQTDAFDILKADRSASLMVYSRIPLSEKLVTYALNSRYLPPMVCEPEDLTTNFESPYLTHNDCLVLGKGNAHAEDICLDVLNIQNKVPLCLNVEFLSTVEEEPTKPLVDPAQRQQWDRFKAQSYELYSLLVKQGNRLWLTHKVDKRGRIYAQGYHISTQGAAFKKASLDLADKEIVGGVPTLV